MDLGTLVEISPDDYWLGQGATRPKHSLLFRLGCKHEEEREALQHNFFICWRTNLRSTSGAFIVAYG